MDKTGGLQPFCSQNVNGIVIGKYLNVIEKYFKRLENLLVSNTTDELKYKRRYPGNTICFICVRFVK